MAPILPLRIYGGHSISCSALSGEAAVSEAVRVRAYDWLPCCAKSATPQTPTRQPRHPPNVE